MTEDNQLALFKLAKELEKAGKTEAAGKFLDKAVKDFFKLKKDKQIEILDGFKNGLQASDKAEKAKAFLGKLTENFEMLDYTVQDKALSLAYSFLSLDEKEPAIRILSKATENFAELHHQVQTSVLVLLVPKLISKGETNEPRKLLAKAAEDFPRIYPITQANIFTVANTLVDKNHLTEAKALLSKVTEHFSAVKVWHGQAAALSLAAKLVNKGEVIEAIDLLNKITADVAILADKNATREALKKLVDALTDRVSLEEDPSTKEKIQASLRDFNKVKGKIFPRT